MYGDRVTFPTILIQLSAQEEFIAFSLYEALCLLCSDPFVCAACTCMNSKPAQNVRYVTTVL